MILSPAAHRPAHSLPPKSTDDSFAGQNFASTGFASDPFAGDPFASTAASTCSGTKADDPFDPFGALSIPSVSAGTLFRLTNRLLIAHSESTERSR